VASIQTRPDRSPSVDVCAIIVSHNSREWLDAALSSLAEHTREVSLAAVVVDNGDDGAGEYAASRYPFVRSLRCENRGFGHANNRGFEITDARFVLFLNPDTEFIAGELDALVAAMERMPDVGLAGVRQVNGEDVLAPTMRRFPSVARALAEALPVERVPLARRLLGERVLDPADYDRTVECDWTSGSAMFARSAAIEMSGGFDERFFLFSEETDLCWRIRRDGWRIVHLPDVTIRHHEQEHGANPRLWAQSAYARLQFADKNLRHPRAYRLALALRYGVRTSLYSLPGRRTDASRREASRAALAAVVHERAPLA
jgi:N-acetylglucosaminyl-diphospho-decaprenol L-rhamnosyltransferase